MALDFHLERKVVFDEDAQYKNLYKWFLYETDDTGKKIDRDQIPWRWDLNFTAINIELIEDLTLSRYAEDKERPTARTRLRAKLRPGYATEDDDAPAYSMFGTKRQIELFELSICETDPEKGERCALWGSPSYTMDIDFRDQVMEDVIQITIFVLPERFAQFVDKVRNHPPSLVSLRLGGVSGFYSEWSPAISTNSIKVLTSLKDHKVEIPEGASISPPVLGEVVEYAISFSTKRDCYTPPRPIENNEGVEISELLEERQLAPVEESVLLQRNLLKLSLETVKRLRHLTYAAWAIAAILVIWATRILH